SVFSMASTGVSALPWHGRQPKKTTVAPLAFAAKPRCDKQSGTCARAAKLYCWNTFGKEVIAYLFFRSGSTFLKPAGISKAEASTLPVTKLLYSVVISISEPDEAGEFPAAG